MTEYKNLIDQNLIDQELMCELCESHILGCLHMTSTFICEGCKCDEAYEYYKEYKEDELIEQREEKLKRILEYGRDN